MGARNPSPQPNYVGVRNPSPQPNFQGAPDPQSTKVASQFGFQPESGSLSQMRERATIFEAFQAPMKGNAYNPLDDLFNDRPIQPEPIITVEQSNVVAGGQKTSWINMDKTSSILVSESIMSTKAEQFKKLQAETQKISNFGSSNLLAKPEDIDDFFSDTHSANYEFSEDDIDEGPRAQMKIYNGNKGASTINAPQMVENLDKTYSKIETILEGQNKGDKVGDGHALANFAAALGLAGNNKNAPKVLQAIVKTEEVKYLFVKKNRMLIFLQNQM
jgi:hypothetical protein